jgi:hypothetical protein
MGGTKQNGICQGIREYKSRISQTTPKAKFKKQEIYPWGY